MFRQLMVGALIIVTVAGLASSFQDSQTAAASPGNIGLSITFASGVTQDGDPIEARSYPAGRTASSSTTATPRSGKLASASAALAA